MGLFLQKTNIIRDYLVRGGSCCADVWLDAVCCVRFAACSAVCCAVCWSVQECLVWCGVWCALCAEKAAKGATAGGSDDRVRKDALKGAARLHGVSSTPHAPGLLLLVVVAAEAGAARLLLPPPLSSCTNA
jgi:hypothetical protein